MLITYIRLSYIQSFVESIKQITEPLVELNLKDKLNARLKNKKSECSIRVLANSNGFIFLLLNRGFTSMTD